MASAVIGIDLGTTFSCAAVYRKDRGAHIISDENGDRIIPSFVYFDPEDGEVMVGKNAIDESTHCPQNGLFDAKRIIGRQYDDEYVSRFLNSKEIPFSLVRDENDKVAYEVVIGGRSVIKTPEDVSAAVLTYLKRASETHLGCEVKEAVISIPAYFSNAQRKATRRAATLAGFNVLKLIAEPTAAAIHYVSDKEKNNAKILVFDFGGGTLDVSIIKVVQKRFQVEAVYGDTFLGGRNIDETLFKHFRDKCKTELSEKMSEKIEKIFLRRLRGACVLLKKKLSTQKEAKISIPSSFGADKEIFLRISKDQFEELNSDLFERALEILKVCLFNSGISKSDINEVVLVGGSTRISKIQRMLRDYFERDIIKTDIHPDEAVAAGASVQALLIKEKSADLEMYNISEVTPLSIGIKTRIDCMTIFVPRNSQLPFKTKKEKTTTENNQRAVIIGVYEGERRNVNSNNFLGEFTITGLPPKRAGGVKYYIMFELDEDGVLSVTATEESTGISKKLVVTMSQFRLSNKEVKITLEDARMNKHEDEVFLNFNILRCKMELWCNQIIFDIEQISSLLEKEFVKSICRDFVTYCNTLNFSETETLESKFAGLHELVLGVLKKNNLAHLKYK